VGVWGVVYVCGAVDDMAATAGGMLGGREYPSTIAMVTYLDEGEFL